MSLPSFDDSAIPKATIRAAKAAFPKGNRYLKLRDELGTIYDNEDFEDLYPHRGQPALAPWRLALVTIFQFMENLADRQAADAVRGRIDWKYALGLELTDPGFDHSVLTEFRTRLLRGEAEQRLLDRMLERLREAGHLKAKGKQRTDSTAVLANIRELTRLELVGETLRAALNEIASVDPEWLRTVTTPIWHQLYDHRIEESRLPTGKKARAERAGLIGQHGFELLEAIDADWRELSDLPAVLVLRQVWDEQYDPAKPGSHPTLQERRGRGPSGRVESPYDPEARYRNRRSKRWTGYVVHLSETCDPDRPRVITHAHTTTADVHEAKCTRTIHSALREKDLLPEDHLADAAYIDAGHLSDASKEGFRLIGPTRKNPSWQTRSGEGFSQQDFDVDYQMETAVCPAGKTAASWREYEDERRGRYVKVRFSQTDCLSCELKAKCTKAKSRSLLLHVEEHDRALRKARALMNSEEGQRLYRLRAGVEAAISQGVRATGLRRSRYRGLEKTRLQHVASAAALNLTRVGAWLLGDRPEPTRTSRFARLAA
jgi:transposase